MGSLIGWLAAKSLFGRTIGDKTARVILTVTLFLTALGAAGTLIHLYNRHVIAVNNQKVEKRAAPATNRAAEERANDAIAESKHAEELHNAIHSVPDAQPAGPSHALACKRLHDLGRNPPACR